MAVLYVVGLTIPCVIGIGSALLLQPGSNLGPDAQESIGALIIAAPPEAKSEGGILGFLMQVIPTNIFEALSRNDVMAIVFLSVTIGLALGTIQSSEAETALGFVRHAVGGGPVLIPTVAPILGAVGIPTAIALVVLSTTDNLIGPVRTATTLQANITLTVMAVRRGQERPEAPADPAYAEEEAAA